MKDTRRQQRGSATASAALGAAPHLPALDGLRGIAVLMVMFFHFMLVTRLRHGLHGSTAGLEGAIDWIADGGWTGVELFFVLSGFLITGILLRARRSPGYFRNFYARRALRIFPLYYATLAFLLFALPLAVTIHSTEFAHLRSMQFWHWTYMTNIWVATTNATGDTDVFATGHLWSLSVEEQFYLLWPAIVLVCGRRTLIGVCAAIVVFSPVARLVALSQGADPFVAYTFTLLRLDALALGALLAAVSRDARAAAVLRRHAPVIALGALAALCALAWWKGDLIHVELRMLTYGLTLFAVLSGSLIIIATSPGGGIVRRIVEARPLRAAGRYSYALYILHWPLATWIASSVDLPGVDDAGFAGRMLFVVVASAASIAAAWLSWNLLERHFLRLKDRFREQAPPALESSPANLAAAA